MKLDALLPLAEQKKTNAILIDWNAYPAEELAVLLQRIRAKTVTASCPILCLLTCPPDVQTVAMTAEYSIHSIIYFSSIENSLSPTIKKLFQEKSHSGQMQSLLARIARAHAQNAIGELDSSVLDLHSLFPKETAAQIEYANYCIRYGIWEKAKTTLGKISEKESKNPRVINLKIRILLKERRYEEASRLIGQAQLMSPNNASRLSLLGDVFAAKGKKDEAREKYQSALTIVDNCRDAKRSLAQLDISEGMLKEALSLLRDSSTQEEMGSFFNDAAIIAQHEGRNTDAHSLYSSALSVLAKPVLRARIYFNVGLAYHKSGDTAAALREFQLAQSEDPSFERAQVAVAWFQSSNNSAPKTTTSSTTIAPEADATWLTSENIMEETLSLDTKATLAGLQPQIRVDFDDEDGPLAKLGATLAKKPTATDKKD